MANSRKLPTGQDWLFKARDAILGDQAGKTKPESYFPHSSQIGGFCWAGCLAESNAFHADEFDNVSQKRFDNRLFLLNDLVSHPNDYLIEIEMARTWMIAFNQAVKKEIFQKYKITENKLSLLTATKQHEILSKVNQRFSEKLANHPNPDLIEYYENLLELKNFIELLVISQHSDNYLDFFPKGDAPGRADLEIAKQMVMPSILEKHGGLQIARRWSNINNQNEIGLFLKMLADIFEQNQIGYRVSFIFISNNHGIHIGYNPLANPCWRFFNLNTSPSNPVAGIPALTEKICQSFFPATNEPIFSLEILPLVVGDKLTHLNHVFAKLENTPTWITWQGMTPEKLQRVDTQDGHTWMHSAVTVGDFKNVKQLLFVGVTFDAAIVLTAFLFGHFDIARELILHLPDETIWHDKQIKNKFHGKEESKNLITWIFTYAFDPQFSRTKWLDVILELKFSVAINHAFKTNDARILTVLSEQNLNKIYEFLISENNPILSSWVFANLNVEQFKHILNLTVKNNDNFLLSLSTTQNNFSSGVVQLMQKIRMQLAELDNMPFANKLASLTTRTNVIQAIKNRFYEFVLNPNLLTQLIADLKQLDQLTVKIFEIIKKYEKDETSFLKSVISGSISEKGQEQIRANIRSDLADDLKETIQTVYENFGQQGLSLNDLTQMIIEDCKVKIAIATERHNQDPISLSLFKPSNFSKDLNEIIKIYDPAQKTISPKKW